jgi:hypothetical protein
LALTTESALEKLINGTQCDEGHSFENTVVRYREIMCLSAIVIFYRYMMVAA